MFIGLPDHPGGNSSAGPKGRAISEGMIRKVASIEVREGLTRLNLPLNLFSKSTINPQAGFAASLGMKLAGEDVSTA